jgi:hypothetical protein
MLSLESSSPSESLESTMLWAPPIEARGFLDELDGYATVAVPVDAVVGAGDREGMDVGAAAAKGFVVLNAVELAVLR